MGLLVIHGAQAGGFSPISIYGGITNGDRRQGRAAARPSSPPSLASFAVNLGGRGLLFFVLGRPQAAEPQADSRASARALAVSAMASPHPSNIADARRRGLQAYGDAEAEALSEEIAWRLARGDASIRHGGAGSTSRMLGSQAYQILTLVGLVLLAVLTLAFNLDIGFVAITIGLVLSLIAPNLQKRAIGQVTWPEIMLITGVSTYVFVLEKMGTIDFVGHSVAGLARR